MFLWTDKNNKLCTKYPALAFPPHPPTRRIQIKLSVSFSLYLSRPNFLPRGLKCLNSGQIISTFSCELQTKSNVQVSKDLIDTELMLIKWSGFKYPRRSSVGCLFSTRCWKLSVMLFSDNQAESFFEELMAGLAGGGGIQLSPAASLLRFPGPGR